MKHLVNLTFMLLFILPALAQQKSLKSVNKPYKPLSIRAFHADTNVVDSTYLFRSGDTIAVRGYIDSAFVGKTRGIFGTGSAAGISYNVNTSPLVNPIGHNSQAVVVIAAGRPHDRNLVGSRTQADLGYVLAGYDNLVDGLMSGAIGAHNDIGPTASHTTVIGSNHVTRGNSSYDLLAGTLNKADTSSYLGITGYSNAAQRSTYGTIEGDRNTARFQQYFHLGGSQSVMTATSAVLGNFLNGRQDTIRGTTQYAWNTARGSSVSNANFSGIWLGLSNRIGQGIVSVVPQYSVILSGTLNRNNGAYSIIGTGTGNYIPEGLTNVTIFDTGVTASTSNTAYFPSIVVKNLAVNGLVGTDAGKKLTVLTALPSGTTAANPTSAAQIANKGYVDGLAPGFATNTTTTSLNAATLNSTYPTAAIGYRVICGNISTGAAIYTKYTATGWLISSASIVP